MTRNYITALLPKNENLLLNIGLYKIYTTEGIRVEARDLEIMPNDMLNSEDLPEKVDLQDNSLHPEIPTLLEE